MAHDLTTPTDINGNIHVECNGCRLAGRKVLGNFYGSFVEKMLRARWRPDHMNRAKWLCPECNGLGDFGPRSMKTAAPEPNVVIVSAFENHHVPDYVLEDVAIEDEGPTDYGTHLFTLWGCYRKRQPILVHA